jgi:hypothetical protein
MTRLELTGAVEDSGGVGGATEGVVATGEREERVDIVVDPGGGFFEVRQGVGRGCAGEKHHAGVAMEDPVVGGD